MNIRNIPLPSSNACAMSPDLFHLHEYKDETRYQRVFFQCESSILLVRKCTDLALLNEQAGAIRGDTKGQARGP
jgi:hypothetical protein